ncbi:MAG: efflux RND transporter periplasmic adaptor subunit [Peptococcaceae bacterium]|nr:efflux RND transporter periplasmic adaptor subunit [Peptococcaceae bacterium]
MRKTRFIFLLAGTLWLALFFSGCARWGQTAGTGGKGTAVPVAVEVVRRGEVVKELVASGQLMGEHSVIISPKISGKVASVPVGMGSEVRAGDVLFTLDDSDLSAQVRQAEAAVAAARARLNTALQNRENAVRQYERYKQLYEQGAISADTFEAYSLKLEQAKSEEPEASLAQSEAALAYQRNQLANTVITSPISGTVAQCSVEVGSVVSPSTQAVTVVDLSTMKVQVAVGEQHIGKIKQGQEVKVVVPAVQAGPFTGTVAALSPAVDPKTRSYLLEVRMDNPGRILKQGMFAEVHIVTDRSEGALTVPVDALVARSGGSVVFIVQEGQAREKQVQTGISDGRVTEIVSGLNEGDQVIVMGQQGLVDGSRVVVGGGKPEAGRDRSGGEGAARTEAGAAAGAAAQGAAGSGGESGRGKQTN